MKKIYLLMNVMMAVTLFISGTSLALGQATLKHSYTFEDGTANDGTGSADGTLHDAASIADGSVILSGGHVSLPAKEINIPSYSNITVESVFKQAEGLSGFTVLYNFGEVNADVTWMGIDYFLYQPTRNDNDFSRFSLSCLNTNDPWVTESGINAPKIADTLKHYVVTVITATEMKLYLDGVLLGTDALSGNNMISNLSNDTALIGASVYSNDPRWRGTVYELNIFEGEMIEDTVKQRADKFLGSAFSDATLSDILPSRSALSPAFDPENEYYDLYVDYGITNVNLEAITAVPGATVLMYDGLGNEIADGLVNFTGDGTDVEIIVTALNGLTELSYYVSIFVNPGDESALLSAIDLSAGAFTYDFDPDSTDYAAIVPYGTTSVEVTGVAAWSGANVSGGGTVTLTDGKGSTVITVTSENGQNTRVYNVDITATKVTTGKDYYIVHEVSKNVAEESEQGPNRLILYNPLVNESTQLWQFEDSGVEGQYFLKNKLGHYIALEAPVPDNWNLVIRESLTGDLDSCRFILDEFEPGRFKIISVARSNSAEPWKNMMGPNDSNIGTWIYSDKYVGSSWDNDGLTVWNILPPEEVVEPYDTYLSEMSIDTSSLNPAFEMFRQEYYVTLPVGTTTLTVSATANDATSTISGAGVIDVSAGAGDITITVTASDPGYTRKYVIHYQLDTPLTLKHSYTFADGTAKDQEGNADGIVAAGEISSGLFTSSVEGDFITLPAEEIALKEYPSITLEAYVLTGENPGWTMLAYFGGLWGSNTYWMSIAGENDLTRATLDQGLGGSEASGLEPGPGENHHYVSVLTNDTIKLYIDGTLAGQVAINPAYIIHNISSENAWLCKSGYLSDPTWIGSFYEFNIYSGQMDATTIANRALNFPAEDSTSDATLSDLMVDGASIEDFASYTLNYEVVLSKNVTEVPAVTATPRYSNASAAVTDAAGIPGTATVVVTAADGVTTNTYSVNFTYVVSKDASLVDLTVDGTTVDNFDPATLNYYVKVPQGTTLVPTVEATANDENATVVVNPAASVPGTTNVIVTAEDGVTVKTYSVEFSFETAVNQAAGIIARVYPTVTRDYFFVKTTGGNSTITVYNMTGRKVFQEIGVSDITSVSLPHEGMYIVKVDSEGITNTFKVFKVR